MPSRRVHMAKSFRPFKARVMLGDLGSLSKVWGTVISSLPHSALPCDSIHVAQPLHFGGGIVLQQCNHVM